MASATELLPWAAVVIQGGLGLFFLGKAKGLLDAVNARVAVLGAKLDGVDHFTDESLSDRARLNARVAALEADQAHGEALREAVAANVQKTREELAAFRGAAEEQHRNMSASMEAVQRDLQGVNRQLANIATERLAYRATETAAVGLPRARRSAKP